MRRAPAYQEYASDVIASESFKLMTLAERGLFHTLRLHCWVDASVPGEPDRLARLIGIPTDEVRAALTENVLSHFQSGADDSSRLACPELESYRVELEEGRRRRSAAGTAGSDARWKKDQRSPTPAEGMALPSDSHRQSPLATSERRRAEQRGGELKRGEASGDRPYFNGNRGPTKPFNPDDPVVIAEMTRAFDSVPERMPVHRAQ